MNRSEALSLFSSLVGRPDSEIPLCHAALLFATDADPQLHVESSLAELRELGTEINGFLPRAIDSSPSTRLMGFLRIFHGRYGFEGDNLTFDSPENSHLHRVVRRRRGLPISLSILAVTLLRQLGLEAYGVALPGRYIARCETEIGTIWFDCFQPRDENGTILTEADCRDLVEAHGIVLNDQSLRQALNPARNQSTLFRMLNNLIATYDRRKMHLEKARTLDWSLMIQPGDMALTLTRAQAYHAAQLPGLAIRDYERFLFHHSQGTTAEAVREALNALRREASPN